MKARPVKRIKILNGSKAGKYLVKVPLGRSGLYEAILYEDDFDELVGGFGLSQNWGFTGTCVMARGPYTGSEIPAVKVIVARVIMGAKEGEIIHYRDGVNTNLCRDNLRIREGFSTSDDRAILYQARQLASNWGNYTTLPTEAP